jgi:hypothetical protein
VRQDYWAVPAAAAETIAIGVAIAVIAERGVSRVAVWTTSAFLMVWLFGTAVGEWMIGHAGLTFAVFVALALIVGSAFLMTRATQPARRRMVAIVAVGLIAVELLTYQNHARLARFDPESPTPAYVAFLRGHLNGDRVLVAGRGALYPEWGAALGIPQIETLNVAQLPAYQKFFRAHIVPQHGLFLEVGALRTRSFRVQPSALDLLSVRYILTDGTMPRFDAGVRAHYPLVFTDARSGVSIYENRHAFPRAFLSPILTARRATGFSERVTRTADRQLLAADPPVSGAGRARPVAARITRYDNTDVRVETDAPRPSVLVLTDVYAYGWHVTVDGRAAHLAQVDEVVRGVVVPSGRSIVVFTYRSRPRTVGAVISALTLLALLVCAGWLAVRRVRRSRAPTGAGC